MHERYLRFRAVRPFAGFAKPAGSADAVSAAEKRSWQSRLSWRGDKKSASNGAAADVEASGHNRVCEKSKSAVLGAVCFASSKDIDPDIQQRDVKRISMDAEPVSPTLKFGASPYSGEQEAGLGCSCTLSSTGAASKYTSQISSSGHRFGEGIFHNHQLWHAGLSGGSSGFVRLMRLSLQSHNCFMVGLKGCGCHVCNSKIVLLLGFGVK
jgi:hypothetical protein